MDPKKWGPCYWYMFHTYAVNYPDDPSPIVKHAAKNFIMGIPFYLPCPVCTDHASAFLNHYEQKIGIKNVISSKSNMIQFFKDFHNSVNYRLGKPIYR
ncbi:hypothetical protein AGMMS49579_00920 [Spirochaetia bacterium]|nr:hypothetical protein AGMMS49579_00920 [Spirochaetia bacterium]